MVNPETGGSGDIPEDKVAEAQKDGLLPGFSMINDSGKKIAVPESEVANASKAGFKISTQPTGISQTESATRGATQGFTGGWADEVGSAIRAVPALVTPGKSYTDEYSKLRDVERADNERAKASNPGTYTAGQVAGAVGSTIGTPLATATKMGTYGATSGLGGSEGSAGNQLKDTAIGGTIGAAAGVAAPYITKGASAVGDKISSATGSVWNKLTSLLGNPELKRQEEEKLADAISKNTASTTNVPSNTPWLSGVNSKIDRLNEALTKSKNINPADYGTTITNKVVKQNINPDDLTETGFLPGVKGFGKGLWAGGKEALDTNILTAVSKVPKIAVRGISGAFAPSAERNAQQEALKRLGKIPQTSNAQGYLEKATERGQPFPAVINFLNQTDPEFRQKQINKDDDVEIPTLY